MFFEFDEYERGLEVDELDFTVEWLKKHAPNLDTSSLMADYEQEWEAAKKVPPQKGRPP